MAGIRELWAMQKKTTMRVIIEFILIFVICLSSNGQTRRFLNTKDSLNFKTEQQTDFIKVSVGNKVIIDTYNRFDTTTSGLKSNQIPKEVFKKVNLLSLSISGMDCDMVINDQQPQYWVIKEIPPEIKNLSKLEILRLPLNEISSLPDEIILLKNLKVIDLTDNNSLSNVDKLAELLNLEEIYLFGCNVSRLPGNIGDLKKLKDLGLTGNPIEKGEIERVHRLLPNCRIVFDDKK